MNVAIIFSGWNHRAIVAFCRFCKETSIPVFIVAKDEKDPILLTDYKSQVGIIRNDPNLSLELLDQVKGEVQRLGYKKMILMPTTEYLNRFFLANSASIQRIGYTIPLCDEHLYSLVSDKIEFEKLCKRNGIATPCDYEDIKEENIPFVVKPRKYFSTDEISVASVAEKPKLIISKEDYEKIKGVNTNEYYCQEFVGGKAYYLLYYFAKDGSYSIYSQENLMQQHGGLSIVAALSSTIHEDARAQAFTNLFLSIGFHGLVMVEFRDYKGRFYMIEANPRFWGPSQLILDAGMDLFERFAKDYELIGNSPYKNYMPGTMYSWFGGVVDTSSLKENIAFHNQYTAEDYVRDVARWLKNDIYLRKDSVQVFGNELNDERVW